MSGTLWVTPGSYIIWNLKDLNRTGTHFSKNRSEREKMGPKKIDFKTPITHWDPFFLFRTGFLGKVGPKTVQIFEFQMMWLSWSIQSVPNISCTAVFDRKSSGIDFKTPVTHWDPFFLSRTGFLGKMGPKQLGFRYFCEEIHSERTAKCLWVSQSIAGGSGLSYSKENDTWPTFVYWDPFFMHWDRFFMKMGPKKHDFPSNIERKHIKTS